MSDSNVLTFGDFTINKHARTLHHADTQLPIANMQFQALLILVENAGKTISRDEFCQALYGRDSDPFERTIDVSVGRVRKLIEPNPKIPTFIKKVWGRGYFFAGEVQVAA